jgi:hypothetical protein
VHIGVVTGEEIKYPRTKTVRAKKRDESFIFFPGCAHGVIDIGKFHSLSFDLCLFYKWAVSLAADCIPAAVDG